MAGQAEPLKKQSSEASLPVPTADAIKKHVAKLYGQGYPRKKIARIMLDHLVNSNHRPEEQRLSQARSKLRRWEQQQSFRDLIYDQAVVDLDLSTPEILRGVASKAKKGRVDAAKFALELTGRYTPKGDAPPTQVVVAINGIPRPHRRGEVTPGQIEIEGEAIEEDLD